LLNSLLVLKVSGQLHLHENPAARERNEKTGKSYQLKHHPVELGHGRRVRLVQDHKAGAAQHEHEAGGETCRDKFLVWSVFKKVFSI
jgi:hypothetical protein